MANTMQVQNKLFSGYILDYKTDIKWRLSIQLRGILGQNFRLNGVRRFVTGAIDM